MSGGSARRPIAIVVIALIFAACAPPPPDDGFSIAPAGVGGANPGALLRHRPWVFLQDPISRTRVPGVEVTQLLYRSTGATGRPNAVTGTLMVPEAPWTGNGPRPLVSFAIGTHGLGDDCAPSRLIAQGLEYEAWAIRSLLGAGWAVVVSDLEGLGTAGLHPYNVGRSAGHAVLDAARAALRVPDSGLGPDTPVGIMGYSQGGGTAAWAAELAGSYAPELRLVGVAAGGVPADLEAVARSNEGGGFIGLVLLTALGFDATYPELSLDSYLNDRGRELVADGRDTCIVSVAGISVLGRVAGTWTDAYVQGVNPLRVPAWRARLAENRLGRVAPKVPVLLQHGFFDTIVPHAQADQLRVEWCAAGTPVTWRTHLLAEHILGYLLAAGPAIEFLAARFDGRPAPGNCPSR
jgi:fermentation-respiration switch protein FrsA (DUF1100 family)